MANTVTDGNRSPHQAYLTRRVNRLSEEITELELRIERQKPGAYRDSLERKKTRLEADRRKDEAALELVESDLGRRQRGASPSFA